MSLHEIKKIYVICKNLERLARQWQRYNELSCLCFLTDKQFKRKNRLGQQVDTLVGMLGLKMISPRYVKRNRLLLVEQITNKLEEIKDEDRLYIEF